MRTRRWVVGVGAGSLLLAGVATGGPLVSASFQDASPSAEVEDDDEGANATPVVGTPLLQPGIDLMAAQEAALIGQDGASVLSVDLDGDEGTLIYDVELDNGLEVEVDATTGEVLGTERSGGDDEDAETEDDGEADDDDDGVEDEDEAGDVDATDDAEGADDDA